MLIHKERVAEICIHREIYIDTYLAVYTDRERGH